MQVVVDSLLTSYRRVAGAGAAKPVLLLHGWGDNSAGWLEFAQQLATEGYDIYAPDLPGFGGTDVPPHAWGLDDYAAFAGAFVRKIGIRPYAIVGHSNGGAIAIRGLANGSLVADKVVLLASAGVRSEYKGRNKALRIVAKAGKALATPLPDSVKDKLRRKLYTSVGSDMLVAEHLQETFKKVVGDDVQSDAGQLKLPALLIYGDDDVSTPPRFGRLLHDHLKNSRLEMVHTAGHFVHQDQPQTVLRLTKEFLA